ncbi:hypothetical protein [Streptomyces tanashiensis]|uniref:hypothetical protein n=1 Tax=Streptomyces tanashiensis TaxID=67367 RepID=UPI0016783017|nr:hypothetical protein [Streptomyces tanashiensis]
MSSQAGPLAAALQVVLEETAENVATSTGEITAPKVATLAAMWEAIEAVVPWRCSVRLAFTLAASSGGIAQHLMGNQPG